MHQPAGGLVGVDVSEMMGFEVRVVRQRKAVRTGASLTGTASGPGVEPSEVSKPDISDQLRSIDVALAVGGGVEFPAGRVSVFLDGLYTHGLRDLPAESADTDFLSAQAARPG